MAEETSISNQDYAAFLSDLRGLMKSAIATASEAYTKESQLDRNQAQAFGLYRRAASLFVGLQELIANGHTEASMILSRSFLTDCLTLRYFALQPGLLERNVVKWVRESLRQELSLEREGDRIGVHRPDDAADSTRKELDELNEYAKTVTGAKGKLPEEKAMATAVGDNEIYWTIKLFSNMVHSTQMSIGRLMPVREGQLLERPLVDPVNLAFVTSHAVTGLFQATEAIGTLFAWDQNEEYSVRRMKVEAEVRRLRDVAAVLQGINT